MPRQLMSGNEAMAYGAYLAGVRVAAAYPGTPSTEILESLARYPGVYAEWAPNEKVAADVAAGAAYAGRRALAAMKHVGLNVAAETLFYTSYTGIEGGLVLITCDDPGMHSSQNEQDNRHYARFAKVPMLEPADSEEAKQLVKLAFEISERFDTPVVVRSTTRISHSKSLVELEETGAGETETRPYRRDPGKYVLVPAYARRRHQVVEERLQRLAEYFEGLEVNRIETGDPELGIITGGVSYQYAREIFPEASFLKLATVWPLPAGKIREFAARVKRLLVLEELDPFLEEEVRLLGLECTGKRVFPTVGELSPGLVRECARKAGLLPPESSSEKDGPAPSQLAADLPARPPMLCPGCSHRPVLFVLQYYAILAFGDIGCYGLGVTPPLSAYHTSGCMGASIGVAHGADKAGIKERRVAIIGDSTLFHAGIPPLTDLVYNHGTTTVIVLDNRTTAMTGHQDHPGTGRTLLGQQTLAVAVEDLARALGFRKVDVVDPFDFKTLRRLILEHVDTPEPSVLVARHPCVLLSRQTKPAYRVNPERCNDCGVCRKLGCAPLVRMDSKMAIDPLLCVGCGFCAQVCGRKAIVPAEQGGGEGGSPS